MEFLEIGKAIMEMTTTTVIIAAVVYLLVKYFLAVIEKKVLSKANEKTEETQLVQYNSVLSLKKIHPFFLKIKDIVLIKIPITSLGGPVRTLIFRDVLTIYFETMLEEFSDLLERDITLDNFLIENYKTAESIICNSTKNMREAGIPEVVIQKFSEWNSKRQTYTFSALSDVDSSEVFATVIEKQFAILNLYTNSAYFTLIDAESTLKSLNGSLTGTIYKGQEVEPLQ